jgi:hypothetical protein
MSTLTVFHYHLRTGGITQVITSSLSSLITAVNTVRLSRIRLVSGSREQAAEVTTKIRSVAGNHSDRNIEVDCETLPEIGYTSEMDHEPEVDELAQLLTERFSGDIWWIHNYHIGKNPPFTEALLQIAAERPQQQMVLHIHDFPESGRYSNLSALHTTVRRPLYPSGPNVRYAVINSRDRELLVSAGIPSDRVFLLNNPVSATAPPRTVPARRQELRSWAAGQAVRWEDEGSLFLYPVRTIRRKNVLEAALTVKLLPEPANLVVTLPGTSSREKPYSDLVAQCFSDGLVPGVWGIGGQLSAGGFTFPELLASADALVSSAVQEGFGYLFIDAVRQRLPLLARELDILEGIKPLFSAYPAHFYRQLSVPLDKADSTELGILYRDNLEKLRGLVSAARLESLHYEVQELLTASNIDFSYLSVDMQRRVLEESDDPAFLQELRRLNPGIARSGSDLLNAEVPEKHAEIQRLFGPAAHAAGMEEIISSLQKSGPTAPPAPAASGRAGNSVHERILAGFTHLDYLRLLYFQ